MKRRNFLPLAALPLLSSFSWAQKYPSSASTIIMPLQAGSASDVAIRHMAERLTQKLGQGFAVENVAAAAGLVGLDRLSKARTDGLVVAALNNSIMTITAASVAWLYAVHQLRAKKLCPQVKRRNM